MLPPQIHSKSEIVVSGGETQFKYDHSCWIMSPPQFLHVHWHGLLYLKISTKLSVFVNVLINVFISMSNSKYKNPTNPIYQP